MTKILEKLFKRLTSKGGTLKSHIFAIDRGSLTIGWTLSPLVIQINKQVGSDFFFFKSTAKFYGDFVTLNERYYFNTPEEALGEATKQVFDVSDHLKNAEILLDHSAPNGEHRYYLWDLSKKSWEAIDENVFFLRAYG